MERVTQIVKAYQRGIISEEEALQAIAEHLAKQAE